MKSISNRWIALQDIAVLGVCLLIAVSTLVGPAVAAETSEDNETDSELPVEEGWGRGTLRIAVVNIDRTLEESRQWRDLRDEVNRLKEKAESALQRRERQIRLLRSEFENLPSGTDRARSKRQELMSALEQYRGKRDEFEKELAAQRTEALTRMLKEVDEAVTAYARRNDIDLVLKAGQVSLSTELDPETSSAALRRAAIADVLYARPEYDVSAEIIKRLNAGYTSRIIDAPQE